MGIALVTALTIQANKAEVAVGRGENGKYGFEIYCIIREHYLPQLTCEPIYDSKRTAKKEGKKLLREIESLDLDNERKGLVALLGDAAPLVEKVVTASKSGR